LFSLKEQKMTKQQEERIIKLLEQVEDEDRQYIIDLLKDWIKVRKQ